MSQAMGCAAASRHPERLRVRGGAAGRVRERAAVWRPGHLDAVLRREALRRQPVEAAAVEPDRPHAAAEPVADECEELPVRRHERLRLLPRAVGEVHDVPVGIHAVDVARDRRCSVGREDDQPAGARLGAATDGRRGRDSGRESLHCAGSVTARMRPRPPTFSAQAMRSPAMERPTGMPAAFATVVTALLWTSTARIESPTRNTIARSATEIEGLAPDASRKLPSGLPVWTSYRSRTSRPAARPRSATTLAESPIATGVELGSMLKMSAPVTALRISTGSLGDATGCPSAAAGAGAAAWAALSHW